MGKCMPGRAYSFPACVGQTNEKSTHSTERACKVNRTLRRGNLVSLPTPLPPPLNHNYRINFWVWILGLNVSSLKTPLSILVATAPSPIHWIISFMFTLKLLLVSHVGVVRFVFCAQKAVCIITVLLRSIMKSKMPPNISLLPIQLLQKPVYLLWSLLSLIPDFAVVKTLNVVLVIYTGQSQTNFLGKTMKTSGTWGLLTSPLLLICSLLYLALHSSILPLHLSV